MKTVGVYKVGEERYMGKVDNNGGLHETKLIKQAISIVCLNNGFEFTDMNKMPIIEEDPEVLFIIGGFPYTTTETKYLECLMKGAGKKIYIMTDALFLDNEEEWQQCNEVWHQSMSGISRLLHHDIVQRYNYVPELFFDDSLNINDNRFNGVLFAGNAVGREDQIEQYINSDKYTRAKTLTLLKTYEYDERIPYEAYLKLLAKFKYTLLLDRKTSSDLQWVTPRVVEAVSRGVLPIVSENYDQGNHFIPRWSNLRIKSADGAAQVIKLPKNIKQHEMYQIIHTIRENQFGFSILVYEAITGVKI
jgi:hypothetical protein